MTAAATFTLSLDCEGLWGMADQEKGVRAGVICDRSLQQAYDLIRRVLEQNQIAATCAFVSAFAAGREAVRQQIGLLRSLAEAKPEWYVHSLAAIREDRLDGWMGDRFYREMRSAGHEMAWHGATHLSLADSTPDAAVELELEFAERMFEVLGHRPETVVFPRNEVGHLPRLLAAGFTTYRAARPGHALARLAGAAREWNVWDRGTQVHPVMSQGWSVSPAGYFLNWPAGLRGLVPAAVTVQRWTSLLRAAVADGQYVHMWFHPHNLVTAPAMQETFTAVMCEVGKFVRSGDLAAVTMADANRRFGLRPAGEPLAS